MKLRPRIGGIEIVVRVVNFDAVLANHADELPRLDRLSRKKPKARFWPNGGAIHVDGRAHEVAKGLLEHLPRNATALGQLRVLLAELGDERRTVHDLVRGVAVEFVPHHRSREKGVDKRLAVLGGLRARFCLALGLVLQLVL